MDADTSLGPRFIEVAARHLEDDPELAAVGGVFYGEPGSGLIGQFQRNEYTRYSLQIRQRRGRVFVLTGTATMFRAEALLDVAAARGVFIPGEPGKVYDTAALTEDNELTLALKSLGATMMSPAECYVVTEIMPTWRNLWKQRQRWQRGALENLGAYGYAHHGPRHRPLDLVPVLDDGRAHLRHRAGRHRLANWMAGQAAGHLTVPRTGL